MRKLLPFIFMLAFSGCSAVTSFFPPPWDNQEYLLFVQLQTKVQNLTTQCSNARAMQSALANDVKPHLQLMKNYTKNVSDSGGGYREAVIIGSIVDEMVLRYSTEPVGTAYCQDKIEIISKGIDTTLVALYSRGQ